MNKTLIPARSALQYVRLAFVGRVIAISSFIAILIGLIEGSTAALLGELILSNTIGLCIWGCVHFVMFATRGRLSIPLAALMSVPIGVLAGGKIATLFGVQDVVHAWFGDPTHQWKWIALSFSFAGSATVFLVVAGRAADYRIELETERRRSAEASRSQAVAELALLQAQIEPHFLFNTLAHVQSAIDQDPALGKTVLEHLIRYLRGTLSRSRKPHATLGEECELVEALLAIAAIRLGKRLTYRVELSPELRALNLPPLLLQPLVENAIKHGIEPAIAGGDIVIQGGLDGDDLVLRIMDTGVGLAAQAPEGVGLSNVRARLASLYGAHGRLTLSQHEPRGLRVEMRLPAQAGH